MAGAAAAGGPIEAWNAVGMRLGEAYQVADDIGDAISDAEEMGKPVGQDTTHDRPSAVRELGLKGAIKRLEELAEAAADAIPPCRGREELGALMRHEARRLVPKTLPAHAY